MGLDILLSGVPIYFQVGASMVPTAFREVFWQRNCRAAEYSEYLDIYRISRVIFFDTIATPACIHSVRSSNAARED